jgi:putative ABC transport system permease protein
MVARHSNQLIVGFAALARPLASVGPYGVSAYLVDQRTHEIRVRVALGAGRRDIVRLVVGYGVRIPFVGVLVGATAALGLTGLVANQLFGVTAHDPLTFTAVSALLGGVVLAACYLPASRAMQVDPVIALGRE